MSKRKIPKPKIMIDDDKLDGARNEPTKEPEPISFAQFLEGIPLSQTVKVTNLCRAHQSRTPRAGGETAIQVYYELELPELKLYCENTHCEAFMIFRSEEREASMTDRGNTLAFLTYICSNCRMTKKIFSLCAVRDNETSGTCYKFGEFPPYGPPTPPRVLRLFEMERDTYLKGRRCENPGLGIGAFAYYRRVVENQKNRKDAYVRRDGMPPVAKGTSDDSRIQPHHRMGAR